MTDAIPLPPQRATRGPGRRLARGLTLAVVFGLVFLLLWLGSVVFRVWWVARQDDRPRSDALVVLGASQYNGTPSPVLEARLSHALDLYEDGVAGTIITVGGKLDGDRYTEAAAGKAWLVDQGVPEDAIVAVGKGSDTWTSLVAVDQVMADEGWTDAVLVTDPWHSFRAAEMARQLGLEAATSPTRTGPVVAERLTEVHYIARETGAYVAYQWQRLTGALPEPS